MLTQEIVMSADHTSALPEAVQLEPIYDAGRLQAELAEVTGHAWSLQRSRMLGGATGQKSVIDWRVLPLRSLAGDPDGTDPGGPGPDDYASTHWLGRLPYLRSILAEIPAPLNAVRLMALGPGAVSPAHRDPKYTLARGLARLHIPILTHPHAVLTLDGVEHCWAPGTLWWGDFSREHAVSNSGPVTRVHAVVDVLLTRRLSRWFPAVARGALHDGPTLFNRESAVAPRTGGGVWTADLPTGFTDFAADRALDGDLVRGRFRIGDGQAMLVVGERELALAPVTNEEYRFVGWSDQRTIEPTDDAVILRFRDAVRCRASRHLAAVTVLEGA